MKIAKILVVEDDATSSALVRHALSNEHRSLLTTPCGNRALELIDQENPDLLILDCALPGKPGIEVLRHFRRNKRFDRVPVFITSGRDSPLYQEAMLAEGAQAFFTKPLDLKRFCAAVSEALDPRAATAA